MTKKLTRRERLETLPIMAQRIAAVWAWICAGNVIIQLRDEQGIGVLVPNPAQVRVFDALFGQAVAGVPLRAAVPKARREGVSTIIQAINLGLAKFFPNHHAQMIGHTDPDTLNVFALTTRINNHLPEEEQGEPTKRSITWPHDSSCTCRTGAGRGPGHGATYNSLHFTEMAYLQTEAGLDSAAVTGYMNIIVDEPHTMIVAEGTGSGPDGEFYDICMRAARGEGDYVLVFIPWFEDAAYRREPPIGWEPSEDELNTQERYSLGLDQLYWYRCKSLAQSTKADMLRQFPSCLMDCFATQEGRVYPLFSPERRYCRVLDVAEIIKPPYELGYGEYSEDFPRETYEEDNKTGLMRGIDLGFAGEHPAVCLWIAYDNAQMPQLVVNPEDDGCKKLMDEMMLYARHKKTSRPLPVHDHGPDALRYAVVSAQLRGLVYVCRAAYFYDTYQHGGPELIARTIHEMSGWTMPDKSDPRDLAKFVPGKNGEKYQMTVCDRSGRGHIDMFNTWGLGVIPHMRPTLKSTGKGEIEDGIGEVAVLLSGTAWIDSPPPPDPHRKLVESAIRKSHGQTPFGRQKQLTTAEIEAIEKEYGASPDPHQENSGLVPRL